MLPCFMADNARNCLFVERELASQSAKRYSLTSEITKFSHRSLSQFRCGVSYSQHARAITSGLFTHIRQIIKLASQCKMVWIHTGRIIAFMDYAHSSWNRPIMNFPTNPVGFQAFPQSLHLPISRGFPRPLPKPAIILAQGSYMIPKLHIERFIMSHICSIPQPAPPCKEII